MGTRRLDMGYCDDNRPFVISSLIPQLTARWFFATQRRAPDGRIRPRCGLQGRSGAPPSEASCIKNKPPVSARFRTAVFEPSGYDGSRRRKCQPAGGNPRSQLNAFQ